jgi:hypothetical protein
MKSKTSRRRFLSQAGLAGAGIAASSVFALPSYSQARGRTAKATLGLVAPRADFNPRLFGAFLEHLGGYTRASMTAIPVRWRGFRVIRKSPTCTCRSSVTRRQYGLQASTGQDGVGPEGTPHGSRRAWNSLETNRHQRFHGVGRAVGTEPACGIQPRHRHPEMAVAYIGTATRRNQWSELALAWLTALGEYWCLATRWMVPADGALGPAIRRKARDIAQQA